MAPNLMLEIKVIRNFVPEESQDRYIQFLSSIKTRDKFVAELHRLPYKEEAFEAVTGDESTLVFSKLQASGIDDKTCYIISEDTATDTEVLPISEALSTVANSGMTAIVVFGRGEMIYVKKEGLKEGLISKQRSG